MAVTLPYNFDTSNVWQAILKKGSWLAAVIAVGIIYSLALRHFGAVLHLSLSGILFLCFWRMFFKNSSGSIGTITEQGVIVHPGDVYGYQLPGPSGEFALHRFQSVRVEHVAAAINLDNPTRPHQRVYLIGNAQTPSILIARADDASQVGQEIAAVLKLPCEETRAPY